MQGLIPIVGGARERGTSMLIEDVACPVDKLGDMMIDLIEMFKVRTYAAALVSYSDGVGKSYLLTLLLRIWREEHVCAMAM
jgi:hypothetical protein